VQQDIAQYYANRNPGQVQVLGVDLWNGSLAQLGNFGALTGATYPLLLNGASATGGNVELLYGTYDNYIVLNKQRVVRYHAALAWPHGNRYHLNEIRACVDSLVANTVGVPPGVPGGVALAAGPNPVRGPARITLSVPLAIDDAEVEVLDVAGRVRATLHRGLLAAGRHELVWEARVQPGVYLVRARLAGQVHHARVIVLR